MIEGGEKRLTGRKSQPKTAGRNECRNKARMTASTFEQSQRAHVKLAITTLELWDDRVPEALRRADAGELIACRVVARLAGPVQIVVLTSAMQVQMETC